MIPFAALTFKDGRQVALFRFACSLVEKLTPAELARAVEDFNQERCDPPKSPAIVGSILRSVARYRKGPVASPAPRPAASAFTERDAERLWLQSVERARTDDLDVLRQDQEIYGFLWQRGLSEAVDRGEVLFGIIPPGGEPKPFTTHHRLISPLYSVDSLRVVAVQARSCRDDLKERKALAPSGSRIRKTAFANELGLRALGGEELDRPVLFGEGLTDFLALAIASTAPVVCVPGVGQAPGAIGQWVYRRQVCIALDRDLPGNEAACRAAHEIISQGGEAWRLEWPDPFTDAGDLVMAEGMGALADFLEEI